MSSAQKDLPLEVRAAQKVAKVLDGHRVDPIMGLLLPGLGDLLCGLVGVGVVGLAAARKVPRITLARMVMNLALSVGIGAVPLVGDAFDFWFRANTRNARLLARSHDAQGRRGETWRDGLVLAAAGLGLLVAAAVPVAVVVLLGRYLWLHAR